MSTIAASRSEHRVIDDEPERKHGKQHRGNRGRVPNGDRNQRQQHDPLASAVQAECDREQPAHCRVEPVKKAQGPLAPTTAKPR